MVTPSYSELVKEIKEEFPQFSIVRKTDSRLMRTLDFFLGMISFGGLSSFMSSFTTTIGNTTYTPLEWQVISEAGRCVILRHERVHLRQQVRYGKVLFALLYLFAFLPVGLAYYRTKFEKQAYAESLRATLEYYGRDILLRPQSRVYMIKLFTGASYLWMWPFRKSVEKWYDDEVSALLR